MEINKVKEVMNIESFINGTANTVKDSELLPIVD